MDFSAIRDLVKIIKGLGPEAMTGAVLIVVGWWLRGIKSIDNATIPKIVILLGGILYPSLGQPGQVSTEFRNPEVWLICVGLLIGCAAWFLHEKIIAKFEDKVPGLRAWLARGEDEKPATRNCLIDHGAIGQGLTCPGCGTIPKP